MKVVCVTGMPGSGKEEFVKVARELEFDIIRMGDLVRDEAEKRGLDMDDRSVGNLANEERELFGQGIWAVRTLPRIKGQRIIIDGIRGIAEIEVFRKAFKSDLLVISIEAGSDVRYERIVQRKRRDATLTKEQFTNRDERERRWGIEQALDEADFVIVNEGSLEEFQKEAERVLEEIVRM
ncbi:MAG: flagellar hook-basal body complex protein FliE [Methanobacteriota archaeon]|nr:MAG: flagellar hook-basal body complex protein FliE [Euryarchaeota archaeon]